MAASYRCIVFLETSPNVFSGGRYHGYMLAHALNALGHETHIVSAAKPPFWDDLKHLSKADTLQLWLSSDKTPPLPKGDFDFVFLVPMGRVVPGFYELVKQFAASQKARLGLVNFESGNWFNSVSPFKKPEYDWLPWRMTCEMNALVISSAKESETWAKNFYTDFPDRTWFDVWSPPINTVYRSVKRSGTSKKSMIAFVRPASAHKGARDLLHLLNDDLSGTQLTLVIGLSPSDKAFEAEVRAACEDSNIRLEVHSGVSDKEKFNLIANHTVLLFPSYFEGYGYPPVEALAVGTHVVCYDLPVVREICGDQPHYVAPGDVAAMRARVLALFDDTEAQTPMAPDTADFKVQAKRLQALLKRAQAMPAAERHPGHLNEAMPRAPHMCDRAERYQSGGHDILSAVLPENARTVLRVRAGQMALPFRRRTTAAGHLIDVAIPGGQIPDTAEKLSIDYMDDISAPHTALIDPTTAATASERSEAAEISVAAMTIQGDVTTSIVAHLAGKSDSRPEPEIAFLDETQSMGHEIGLFHADGSFDLLQLTPTSVNDAGRKGFLTRRLNIGQFYRTFSTEAQLVVNLCGAYLPDDAVLYCTNDGELMDFADFRAKREAGTGLVNDIVLTSRTPYDGGDLSRMVLHFRDDRRGLHAAIPFTDIPFEQLSAIPKRHTRIKFSFPWLEIDTTNHVGTSTYVLSGYVYCPEKHTHMTVDYMQRGKLVRRSCTLSADGTALPSATNLAGILQFATTIQAGKNQPLTFRLWHGERLIFQYQPRQFK